jgi:hypothetical protein
MANNAMPSKPQQCANHCPSPQLHEIRRQQTTAHLRLTLKENKQGMAVWIHSAIPVSEAHFPTLQSKTLDGRAINLPADFPGERTLIILGFQRSQQPSIEAWAKGIQHLGGANIPWLQLPVIDNPNAVVRAIVNGGMRHVIDRAVWPHVVTLYTQKAEFERTVGIESEASVQVLVVDRSGSILERVIGDYTPEAANRLLAALR